jgi:tetratricopeptide (TPR) repeat protein
LARQDQKKYDEAIADYTEAIRLNAKDPDLFYYRGTAWQAQEEFDKAMADYTEAVRLDPHDAQAFRQRGGIWFRQKQYDKAIADYSAAIRLSPKYGRLFVDRAKTWTAKKAYSKALADYDQAVSLDAENTDAFNGRAWLLATCPDSAIRDGKKAAESAKRACALTSFSEGVYLDTLAAACAEAGDFAEAVKWQKKALDLPGFDQEGVKRAHQRLKLYQEHTAYHQE